MISNQPGSGKNAIHPELLAGIEPEWQQAMIEFLTTGSTLVGGFHEFLNSSKAAQAAVDAAFDSHLRGAAQIHIERTEKVGGVYQASESISEQFGLSLDQGMKISGFLEDVGERMRKEQKEDERDLD